MCAHMCVYEHGNMLGGYPHAYTRGWAEAGVQLGVGKPCVVLLCLLVVVLLIIGKNLLLPTPVSACTSVNTHGMGLDGRWLGPCFSTGDRGDSMTSQEIGCQNLKAGWRLCRNSLVPHSGGHPGRRWAIDLPRHPAHRGRMSPVAMPPQPGRAPLGCGWQHFPKTSIT